MGNVIEKLQMLLDVYETSLSDRAVYNQGARDRGFHYRIPKGSQTIR